MGIVILLFLDAMVNVRISVYLKVNLSLKGCIIALSNEVLYLKKRVYRRMKIRIWIDASDFSSY